MLQKFNIALLPKTNQKQIIEHANLLSHIADNYLLGADSHPHITLHQFEADESHTSQIWENINRNFKNSQIELTLHELSCITFNDEIFWVSLMPNMRALLTKMHVEMAPLVNKAIKRNFDPHMTLINSRDPNYSVIAKGVFEKFIPITAQFSLALGCSDKVGQFTNVIYEMK